MASILDQRALQLPIGKHLSRISQTLCDQRLLVLRAEPGAGKSTLVPAFLLLEPWLADKAIIMLQPRRLAAIAVAGRIAENLGKDGSGLAGYRVRGASSVGPSTRIEVVTEALLTRRIQDDPLLEQVGLVIFDEFHERSIHADLALALALEVRSAVPELALLVMSATMDCEPVCRLIGQDEKPAPFLDCPGKMWPVKTSWETLPATRWENDFAHVIAEQVQILEKAPLPPVADAERFEAQDEGPATILAFVPGTGEIFRTISALNSLLPANWDAKALHGTLPITEQRQAILPSQRPRVIVCTSIAETSLTVAGVRAVVDSGWSRLTRFHPGSGMDRLVTERICTAQADQRRGRAGRTGPGFCVRCWPEHEALVPTPSPEILRSDLASLVLECAAWGIADPQKLRWIDKPPQGAWAQSRSLLELLGFLRADGSISAQGRKALLCGTHPRFAAMMLPQGDKESARAALIAAIILTRDDGTLLEGADLEQTLAAWHRGKGSSALRHRVMEEARRLELSRPASEAGGAGPVSDSRIIATGYPDRIARRTSPGSWQMFNGRVARLSGSECDQGLRSAEWIIIIEADAGQEQSIIRHAIALSEADLNEIIDGNTTEQVEVYWNGLAPRCVKKILFGSITLKEHSIPLQEEPLRQALHKRLEREGRGFLPWDKESERLWERISFCLTQTSQAGTGDDWEWILSWCNVKGGPVLDSAQLREALRERARGLGRQFEQVAPESILLPTGQKRRIDYANGCPMVEARIQEVFGLTKSPVIGGHSLTFTLLSPAQRPVQVTRDLESFWKNTWPEIRKELRGRYPRHYWPEDPSKAEPTAKAKPRGS